MYLNLARRWRRSLRGLVPRYPTYTLIITPNSKNSRSLTLYWIRICRPWISFK